MKADLFLSQFTAPPAPDEGVPEAFHLALRQSWRVALAEAHLAGAAPPAADDFLRNHLFSRFGAADAPLLLTRALTDYLNAPVEIPSALPLTRFMFMVYRSLGVAAPSFDLSQMQGALRFYHAFAGQLAQTYHFPPQLVPEGVGALLGKAGAPVSPPPGTLGPCLSEESFLSAPAAAVGVNIVGPSHIENGLGSGVRYMADGLLAAGVPFTLFSRHAESGSRAGDRRYEAYETARPEAPVNIIHFNSDMLAENLLASGIGYAAGRYNIGYFVWETSRLSRAHRLGVGLVDEIWVPTQFMAALYRQVTDKPVHVMGSVVNPPAVSLPRARFGLPEDAFLFLFTYDSTSRLTRKNPLAVVRAFQEAFPGQSGVHLVLKTQNAEKLAGTADATAQASLERAAADDSRIHYINATLSAPDVAGLIGCADAYVSLHRCEGFGYGMAEAMALGRPVIATAWSGSADFITPETALPVPSRLVPVGVRDFHHAWEGGHEWAEPDHAAAVAHMRRLYADADLRARLARAGQDYVRRHYSPQAVGAAMAARLTMRAAPQG